MSHSMMRHVAMFLHNTVFETVTVGGRRGLQKDDMEVLKSLDYRTRLSLVRGSRSLKISREEIDKIGEWFIGFMPKLQMDSDRVSSAIIRLDSQFVTQAGGPKNPDFSEMIKMAVKR